MENESNPFLISWYDELFSSHIDLLNASASYSATHNQIIIETEIVYTQIMLRLSELCSYVSKKKIINSVAETLLSEQKKKYT